MANAKHITPKTLAADDKVILPILDDIETLVANKLRSLSLRRAELLLAELISNLTADLQLLQLELGQEPLSDNPPNRRERR